MPRVNQAQVEEEMRKLAEERTRSVAGDSPMLSIGQAARVWNKSPYWVRKMQTAGRVPTVPWGSSRGALARRAARRRDLGTGQGSVRRPSAQERSTARYLHDTSLTPSWIPQFVEFSKRRRPP
jgi:hypothetical protein